MGVQYDKATGLKVTFINGTVSGEHQCFALAPNDNLIARGGCDGLAMWNIETQTKKEIQDPFDSVSVCAFSPDGTCLAVGGRSKMGKSILVLLDRNLCSKGLVFEVPDKPLNSVCFSPDGDRIALGTIGEIILFDARSGKRVGALQAHRAQVFASFSPDATRIVSGGHDNAIRIWDANCSEVFGDIITKAPVLHCSYSPDGLRVASGHSDGAVRLWDSEGRLGTSVSRCHPSSVSACTFTSDGRYVISTSKCGSLWVLRSDNGRTMAAVDGHGGRFGVGLAVSPDRMKIAVYESGAGFKKLRLWQLPDARQLPCLIEWDDDALNKHWDDLGIVFRYDLIAREELCANALCFSPDALLIAAGLPAGRIGVWDARTSGQIAQFAGHDRGVTLSMFSPDGKTLLTGGHDGLLRLWSRENWKEINNLPARFQLLNKASFSPNGKWLISGAGNDLLLWDISVFKLSGTLASHTQTVLSCVFSPNGTCIASGAEDGRIKIWNTNGEQLCDFACNQAVHEISWHPSGTELAAAVGDGQLIILRLENMRGSSVTSAPKQ